VDMATTVALEMEEKRRKEEWEKMEEEAKTKVINNILPVLSYVSPNRYGNCVCEPSETSKLENEARTMVPVIKHHWHD
jgi:hypothetical protein